jgi:hypothetical protein
VRGKEVRCVGSASYLGMELTVLGLEKMMTRSYRLVIERSLQVAQTIDGRLPQEVALLVFKGILKGTMMTTLVPFMAA